MNEFMEKAKGLAKNPLGIIALFISLIYGFACLVLSNSINNLCGPSERLPLIWFVIGFPIFILVAFVFLVINHHEKLYAPSDYKDETNFIKIIDSNRQTQRMQTEVQNIVEDIALETQSDVKPVQELDERKEKFREIQNKYILSEDLALRVFEIDKGIPVKRQARFATKDNLAIEFDGLALNLPNEIYGIEVKYTQFKYLSNKLKQRTQEFFEMYDKNYTSLQFKPEFIGVLIIVSENNDNTT